MKPVTRVLALVALASVVASAADLWFRPLTPSYGAEWGHLRGVRIALSPTGFFPRVPGWAYDGGPRGLIRIGYPALADGSYDHVNFIAVEPIVDGKRALVEMEPAADGFPGRRLWSGDATEPPLPPPYTPPHPGILSEDGRSLSVVIRCERASNGAHVRVVASFLADAPDEVQFRVYAESDSAPIEACVLSTTMGNKARLRQLWLRDGVVTTADLYASLGRDEFGPHRSFARDRLLLLADGSALVAATTDEKEPARTQPPFPPGHQPWWRWDAPPLTQYWRRPAGHGEDLRAVVNARASYWASGGVLVPGGYSFENFELFERFTEGQRWIFGVTARTPAQLGF